MIPFKTKTLWYCSSLFGKIVKYIKVIDSEERRSLLNTYLKSIKHLFDLVSNTFDLPVFFITPEGKVVYECLNKQVLNPLYVNQKHNLFNPLNFDASVSYHFPVIRKTIFSEKYLIISVFNNKVFKGTLLIGPSLSYPLSEDRVNAIINDSRAFFYREEVFKYYKSIPIFHSEKLINISIFVFHLLNNEFLSPELIRKNNSELSEPSSKNINIDLTVSENLQISSFHDRIFEKNVIEIIKEGRVDQLKNLQTFKEEEAASLLSKSSYVRSLKNHIITLITLVSRASIEGGLHDEIAFGLHDRFIQRVEEVNRIDEVKKLASEVLYTFAEKVKEAKNERFSKTITSCKDYIYKHLYDDISHDEIAKTVNLSPKYLSVLFKKEVGITVSEYIQKNKVEEAKKLLAYSKTPISEIYSLLNFNDQSYFTKVFKKVVGVTPKQFREKHHLLDKSKS